MPDDEARARCPCPVKGHGIEIAWVAVGRKISGGKGRIAVRFRIKCPSQAASVADAWGHVFLAWDHVFLESGPGGIPPLAASTAGLAGRFQSLTVVCLARVSVSLPSGASSVMVEPAPMVAPTPMRTGATSMLPDPMKAPSPM